MNGLEKITGRIQSDAELEARRILDKASQEAEETAQSYTRRAKEESDAILEAGRAQAAAREERLESAAGLEGRKLLLAEKQALLDETFALALAKLQSLAPADYGAFLARQMARASVTGREQVVMNARDSAQVGQEAVAAANAARPGGGQLTLSAQTRDMAGGFILVDGPVEVNCTLESLVARQKEQCAGQVAQALFGQGS